jgi:acyl phosphate:glycerol-3-phosphate acyltransferase
MLSTYLIYPLVGLIGYILGSFPTGFIMCKLVHKIDIRDIGSGRTGGTNVLRASGGAAAVITIVGDTLKGFLAVWIAKQISPNPIAPVVAGSLAVLGHNYSVFLGWAGGAGSMVNIGVMFGLSPLLALSAGLVSAVPTALLRFASLGSIVLAIVTPLTLLVGGLVGKVPMVYVAYGLVSGAMTLYELRPNIKRLVTGTERRIGERPRMDTAPAD